MAHNDMLAALTRLNGREMAINTETADEFLADITRFSMTRREEIAAIEADARSSLCAAYGFDDRPEGEGRKPFIYQDGVAVIPVHGALINRFGGSWGFVTGYNFIRRQLNLVLDDEDVDYFVLDVNSPGGEVSGCFELAREIMASRRVKPSLAMVDALMASGGMAVGGSATKAYAIPSARVGSIGVYRQHISIEEALKNDGVKITFATAGEHKIDGTPYKDLPDSVLKDWTQEVNKTWDDFIALVSESRDMDEAAVRETQARVYRADEALALGLINAVKTTADALPAFVAEIADDQPSSEEDDDMADEKGKGAEATSGVDYDRINSMIGTAVGTAMAGIQRAADIKAYGTEKGMTALGVTLAANVNMSFDDAKAAIDAAAADKAPKGKAKAKVTAQEPNDGDEGDEGDEDGDDDEDGDEGDDDDDAEQARANRRGSSARNRQPVDNVNHLDAAMSSRAKSPGAGKGKDDSQMSDDEKASAALLGDYAAVTGTKLGPRAAA